MSRRRPLPPQFVKGLGAVSIPSTPRTAAFDGFQPIFEQPQDAAFEIDALDPVEPHLGLFVPGEHPHGHLLGLGGGLLAVCKRPGSLQRVFQFASVILGNLHVAILMSLDVGKQRVPEEADLGIGMPALAPERQDDLRFHGHDRRVDPARAQLFRVSDPRRKRHLRRPGMAKAGCLYFRSAFGKLRLDFVEGLPANAVVGIGLDDIGCASRTDRSDGEQGRQDKSLHFVASARTLRYGLSRRNGNPVAQDRPTMTIRWNLAHGRHLDLGDKAVVMGILNVTPDSFSDGGLFEAPERALAQASRMVTEGAAIVDVGGESTRPNAQPISAEEEQQRVLPVIEELARRGEALISIDTFRAETARLAVEAGAHIVNDVWGLQREPDIARVAAQTGAGLVIMHTGRCREKLPDVIEDQVAFLKKSLNIAREAGVGDDQIVLDPGFGFAKETPEENLELMARFNELHALGFPLMAGTSRKRFIGAATGREAPDRDVGTAATSVILRLKGAQLFRVHDVAINVDALAMTDAMLACKTAKRISD